MPKRGRPRLTNVLRYASDRIKPSEIGKASPKVQAERDLFNAKCFKGGGQAVHSRDTIGKLWLAGKLDTPGVDDTEMLRVARAWLDGRSAVYRASLHAVAKAEQSSRSSNDNPRPTREERDYYRFDELLRQMGDYERQSLTSLMVDEKPLWALRIIDSAILAKLIMQHSTPMLACAADDDVLDAAKRALVAMVGTNREAMR